MQNVLFFFSVFWIKYASGLQCPPGAPIFTKQCEGALECEAGTPPAGTGCTCGCACCGSGEMCDELVGDCIKAEGEGEGEGTHSILCSFKLPSARAPVWEHCGVVEVCKHFVNCDSSAKRILNF